VKASSQLQRKWRRFNHKHGVKVFIAFLVAGILALVAFLMYILTSPNWRPR
jgi:uncharacterized membrane protein